MVTGLVGKYLRGFYSEEPFSWWNLSTWAQKTIFISFFLKNSLVKAKYLLKLGLCLQCVKKKCVGLFCVEKIQSLLGPHHLGSIFGKDKDRSQRGEPLLAQQQTGRKQTQATCRWQLEVCSAVRWRLCCWLCTGVLTLLSTCWAGLPKGFSAIDLYVTSWLLCQAFFISPLLWVMLSLWISVKVVWENCDSKFCPTPQFLVLKSL